MIEALITIQVAVEDVARAAQRQDDYYAQARGKHVQPTVPRDWLIDRIQTVIDEIAANLAIPCSINLEVM